MSRLRSHSAARNIGAALRLAFAPLAVRLTNQVFSIVEMADRSELVFAGGIIEPIPIITAAEQKITVRQHGQMVFIFAPAEVEDQKIIGGQQKMFLAAAHIECVQGV